MRSVRRLLSRWFLVVLGALSAAVTLAISAVPGQGRLLEGAFAVLLAGALAAVGYWRYARTDLPSTAAGTVARWTLAGFGVLLAMNVWFRSVPALVGAVAPAFAAVTSLTAGLLGGAVIGITVARQRRELAERREREARLREEQRGLRTVVENAPLVLFALDEDGRFTRSEGMGLAGLGLEPGEVVGESVFDLYAGEDAVLSAVERALDGEAVAERVALGDREFETWFEPVGTAASDAAVIGVARDVTGTAASERRLERLHEATRALSYVASAEAASSVAVDIAADVLDTPVSTFWTYDAAADRIELAAATDDTEQFLAAAGVEELPPIEPGDVGMEAFRAGQLRVVEDYDAVDDPAFPRLDLGTVLLVPVGDHGLLELGAPTVTGVTDAERYRAEILAANVEAALDRLDRERELRGRQATLEALHDRTREMVTATDRETVAETVVATARDVLELPLTTVWLVDESGARLEPAAWTDAVEAAFDGLPTYTAESESISWAVYEAGEARVVEDVGAEPLAHDPDSPAGSELVVPLGEHGVLNAGSPERDAFDEGDLQLVQMLAANAVAALERVDREAELRRRNSQMEFFNSILRHDVLNGMTVIRARGEVLAERLDGQDGGYADTIVEWSDDVVDVVRRVRTVLDTLTGEGTVTAERVDCSALLAAEADRVRGTYPGVDLSVEVPDGLEVLADELLAEVLGNVLTNAVEHNDPEGLRVRVTADVDEETVRLRVADDGTGVPDDMKDAVFRRGETAHAKTTGSGFGLFFVDSMVAEYGGDVWVEDSDMGGAAFVIELPRPAEPSPFRESR